MRRSPLNEKFNFPFTLAPMVGLSHIALRLLIRSYLPKNAHTFWPTEMLSSKRLGTQTLGETPQTLKDACENNIIPQILGNREDHIKTAVEKLELWGAVGIDINMGCPVKKALKHNYGVALMGDPDYAASIVAMTVKNTKLPVSVKLRAGFQKDHLRLIDTVKKMENAGVSWVCLHPRTAEQKRKGQSDWEQIKILREHTSIPIIGNGDIQVYSDALKMIEQTSCDAVMIGRALCARPWLFWQLGEKMGLENPPGKTGRAPQTSREEAIEYGNALIKFTELCEKHFLAPDAWRRIRFYIRVSHPWINFGHRLNSIAHKHHHFDPFKEELKVFFNNSVLKMTEYTDLRY